jgi:predicted transposase YdaD
MKQRKSDILWKVIMEEVFPDLLRFIFPDADEVYNMERGFEFLDKELAELNPQPEEEKDSRFADKLVKVYHRDGVEEWVLLHVEVQGDTQDRDVFAERMYTYFYRIRDRYPGRLVSALAIFTGQGGNRMPGKYIYEYRGTKLTYEYPTMSILDYSDEDLDKSSNPFAHVVVAAKMRLQEGKVPEDELLKTKLLAARKLTEKGFGMEKIRAIFNFLRNYVLFEKPETNRKFDNLFRQTDKTSVMNTVEYLKMEGRSEGKKEAAVAFVENLLKGCDFSIEKIASLANVSVEFVNKVKSKLNGTR